MRKQQVDESRRSVGRRGSVLLLVLGSLLLLRMPRIEASDEPPAAKGPTAVHDAITFPPRLPHGQQRVTDTSEIFLKPPAPLKEGVTIAEAPPTIDFLYYPGQLYPGRPWSGWGDGLAVQGKYYSAIGDHRAIGMDDNGSYGTGTAFVFEYVPAQKTIRQLADIAKVLALPEGHYTPGKIHSRLELGQDGWLYFSTHRGSVRATRDQAHYRGDWILRCDPQTGKTEVVVQAPVSKHSIPCGALDPDRLIFYGGTAAGADAEADGDLFFAYDVSRKELLYSGPDGPSRDLIFARSTGRVYWVSGTREGPLMRFDPNVRGGPPVRIGGRIGLRAATRETPQGKVYTVSSGQGASDANLWEFDTRTESVAKIGTVAVGTEAYVASIDADPTGSYLYYVPGAHGGSDRDGTPVVQFEIKTGKKKVLAYLHPFYRDKYGVTLKGTYSTAISPEGDTLFVTWNASRGGRNWDCCALTAIHIPATERKP